MNRKELVLLRKADLVNECLRLQRERDDASKADGYYNAIENLAISENERARNAGRYLKQEQQKHAESLATIRETVELSCELTGTDITPHAKSRVQRGS